MSEQNIASGSTPRQPLISCIVPVFNGERFLAVALNSIFAQTWRPIEVIVVDDGSTDGTKDAVGEYSGRLTYIRQENAGPAAARNTALAVVRGEFIAFLDADDFWLPEKLARQMACFAARPDLEMCITYQDTFWEKEREHDARRLTARNHPFVRPHPGYVCQTLLARRHVFDKVGGFDPSLRHGEDTDWYARTEEEGIVREVLPEALVCRRMHSANWTLACTKEDRMKIFLAKLQRQRKREPGAEAW
jgi:glycosyltransferase involved in cell wall biosynthesis